MWENKSTVCGVHTLVCYGQIEVFHATFVCYALWVKLVFSNQTLDAAENDNNDMVDWIWSHLFQFSLKTAQVISKHIKYIFSANWNIYNV